MAGRIHAYVIGVHETFKRPHRERIGPMPQFEQAMAQFVKNQPFPLFLVGLLPAKGVAVQNDTGCFARFQQALPANIFFGPPSQR